MSETAPPKLGDLPSQSEFSVPTLSSPSGSKTGAPASQSNGNSSMQNAKDTVYNNASSAYNAVADHPVTQNVAESVNNAPVTKAVKIQSEKTSNEYTNLANSRITPTTTAANGQQLTNYHSFFYTLLSWKNPRMTAISYAMVVASIFAARYLPILRLAFKALYWTLGAAAGVELAGKTLFSQGLISSFRPKKYYTIHRETLEASLEDVEQLINFFVIEFQRILYAENVTVTIGAFLVSLLSYFLVKLVPFWGLALIGVSSAYLAPLIYINNKEIIDEQLNHISEIANSQTTQIKELAAHHTSRATSSVKTYAGDYSAKAQEMIGNARGRSTSPEVTKSPASSSAYSDKDFPTAPKQEFALGGESDLPSAPNGDIASGGMKNEPSLI